MDKPLRILQNIAISERNVHFIVIWHCQVKRPTIHDQEYLNILKHIINFKVIHYFEHEALSFGCFVKTHNLISRGVAVQNLVSPLF